MYNLALLLEPTLLSLKNSWRTTLRQKDRRARNVVLVTLCTLFVAAEYRGGIKLFEILNDQPNFLVAESQIIVSLLFLLLSTLLIFSNFVQALSAFYTGKDLDLILSSPISPLKFFFGKYLEVLFSTTWMGLILVLPIIGVLKTYYALDLSFVFRATMLVLPLFIIPCSLSFILAAVYPLVLPRRYSKEIIILAGLSLLYIFIKLLILAGSDAIDASAETGLRFAGLTKLLNVPIMNYLPPYWIASSVTKLIEHKDVPVLLYFILSLCLMTFLTSFAYLLFNLFYFSSFSKLTGQNVSRQYKSSTLFNFINRISSWINTPKAGIMAKDYVLFSRDITQAGQSFIFFGVSSFYLYALQSQKLFQAEQNSAKSDYFAALFASSNASLEAFIMIAVGTRLIFPSVSLEGSSFWTIHSSPISINDVLKSKLYTWFIPTSIILGILFSLASYALNGSYIVAIIKLVCTVLMTYGIAGLAIGFGAYFCNLNWDHSSELAAGFGSLLFILCSFIVSVMQIAFSTILLSKWKNGVPVPIGADYELSLNAVCAIALLALFNFALSKTALKMGERQLLSAIS